MKEEPPLVCMVPMRVVWSLSNAMRTDISGEAARDLSEKIRAEAKETSWAWKHPEGSK